MKTIIEQTMVARSRICNELGNSRAGRVVLHTMCMVRHPEKARWFWRGIVREFAR